MPSHFTSAKELRGKEIAKGVMMKPLPGKNVMLSYLELAPGSEVATHSHPHEQGEWSSKASSRCGSATSARSCSRATCT